MGIKCEIKFDNPNGIYFAGQTLTGRVELTVDKPKKIRCLCLKIEGYAKCSWTEHDINTSSDNKEPSSKHYTANQEYLNTSLYLLGCNEEIDDAFAQHEFYIEGTHLELASGFQTYRFTCQLPDNLPTSFEAKKGHIRYTVKVALERPWKFDLTYKVGFTVLKPQDLNNAGLALLVPIKREVSKNFFMGVLGSNRIYMKAEISTSGFVAGQTMDVAVDINNQSSVAIDEIKISLKEIIQYHSQQPRIRTKEDQVTVKSEQYPGVQKNLSRQFNLSFTIPAVPPTNIDCCKVINFYYEIKVKAKAKGLHRGVDVRLPITIGTIPLSSKIMQEDSHQPRPLGDLYAPPNYDEAMMHGIRVDLDEQHSLGSQVFNLQYPLYHFGTAEGALTSDFNENADSDQAGASGTSNMNL